MSNENLPEELVPTAEVEEFTAPGSADSASPNSAPAKSSKSADDDVKMPTETYTWYYSLRDLIDEFFWGVIFLLVLAGLFCRIPSGGTLLYIHNIITLLFGVGIVYFVILYNPFRFRKKENYISTSKVQQSLEMLMLIVCFLIFVQRLAGCMGTPKTEIPQEPTPLPVVTAPADAPVTTPVTTPAATPVPTVPAAAPAAAPKKPAESVQTVVTPVPVKESTPAVTPAPAENETATPVEEATPAEGPAATPSESGTPHEEASVSESTSASESAPSTSVSAKSTRTSAENGKKAADNSSSVAKKHTWTNYFQYTLIAIFSLFTGLYWLSLIYRIFFNQLCTYYKLTPTLFIFKKGFFVTELHHIAVWDIAQVNITRNLWQRFTGVGTIELRIRNQGFENVDASEESSDNILELPGLRDPRNVQEKINTYRLFIRNRMGHRVLNQ